MLGIPDLSFEMGKDFDVFKQKISELSDQTHSLKTRGRNVKFLSVCAKQPDDENVSCYMLTPESIKKLEEGEP